MDDSDDARLIQPYNSREFRDTILSTCRSTTPLASTASVTATSHAVEHALVAAEDDTGKCLYLGPDLGGNFLEVISVLKEDGDEVVIHAMPMRAMYEPLLRDLGDADD